MRYIKLLIGFLFLSSLTFAQKQTYGDFRAKTDRYFKSQLKNKPDDESLLKEYKYYQRFTWFWDTRVDYNGLSDNYFLEMNKFIANNNELKNSVPYSAESIYKSAFWEIIGPNTYPTDPYGRFSQTGAGLTFERNSGIGRIDAIWVDPNDVNHLLIGAFGGGLWETTNGGINWTPKTEGLNALTVNQIEVIDGVIYLACGFDFGSAKNFSNVHFGNKHGLGVIRSTDWGNTWIISNQKINAHAFSYHESNPQLMYAVNDESIYKSTDGGITWLHKQTVFDHEEGTSARFNDIIAHPTDTMIAYAVGKSGVEGVPMIFKTENGGDDWYSVQATFNGLTGLEVGSNYKVRGGSFDYNSTNGKLYLAFTYGYKVGNTDNRRSFIFESSNWLTSGWHITAGTTVNNNGTSFAGYTGIKTNLINNKIYQLGVNLYERNIGTGTNRSNGKIHDDMRAMEFSPDGNTMFVGHDGGISKSTDNGANWININGDLNLNLSFEMGYYSDLKEDSIRLYDIGTQDTGWYRNKMDGTPRYATRQHEGSVYTSPHTERIYFKNGGLEISNNGSETPPTYANINQPEWESPLIEDPVDKNTTYVSSIKGGNWDSLFLMKNNSNLHPNFWKNKTPPVYSPQRGAAIDIPHSNNNIIHYVTVPGDWGNGKMNNIIWKSEDQGESWCNITNNLTSYFQGKSIRITSINSDSFNPNRIWITIGGISEDGSHVYYSSNGGQSWTNITHNLPNLPVNTVEYDENRKIVFIGTDYGVYYLDGATWKEYGNDLPKAIVTSLFIDDLYNEIVVSTFGRGAWKAPLDICSDEVIYENTTWSTHKTICGDLIVKAGKTLTVNNSNISVKNIIIEPGAKIIWNGGNLSNTSGSSIKVAKGVCALYNGSLLRLNNVTINNYNIEARQESTVSLNTASFIASSLNLHNQSFFHLIDGTSVALDLNSNVNLFEGFSYGFHSSLSLVNFYAKNYASINMTGAGYINGYDNDILYMQNQNFQEGNYNLYSYHELLAGYNVTNTILPGNFRVQNNVKMKMEAGESILLDVGSEITNTNFLAQINPQLAEPPICHESLPPDFSIKERGDNKEEVENQNPNSNFTKRINIYPNPSTGVFNYNLSNMKSISEYSISIYDLTGNLIQKFNSNKEEGKVDLSRHNAGTYALVFEMNDKVEKLLIIKK